MLSFIIAEEPGREIIPPVSQQIFEDKRDAKYQMQFIIRIWAAAHIRFDDRYRCRPKWRATQKYGNADGENLAGRLPG
jgi:hypothetical protein